MINVEYTGTAMEKRDNELKVILNNMIIRVRRCIGPAWLRTPRGEARESNNTHPLFLFILQKNVINSYNILINIMY